MFQALVSVVIPFYKGELYLEKTLESILMQSYSSVEILIINDGCPITSNAFFDTISQFDQRISIHHQSNGGVASARKFGIEMANGDFVAFCDQDDLWLPDKLAKQMPLFEKYNTGLVYCGAIEDHVTKGYKVKLPFFDTYRGKIFKALITRNEIVSCTAVARRSLLLEVEAFDEDIALMGVDDWLAWLKMSLVCDVDFVDEYLAVHIFHDNNYSSNEEKMYKAELVCLEKILEFARNYPQYKNADYQLAEINMHMRYAESFIYGGDFSSGAEALLKAANIQNSSKLRFKGIFFKWVPDFLLNLLQKIKRLSND